MKKTEFEIQDGNGKRLGVVAGKSAQFVAQWLGGKLAQSSPGWARIEMPSNINMIGGVRGICVGSEVFLKW